MRLPVPLPRVALLVAAGALIQVVVAVVAPELGPAVLVVWLAVVTVVALADLASAPSPDAIGMRRELPHAVDLDADAALHWIVSNPTAQAQRVAVADELAPSLRPRVRRTDLIVPARGTASVAVAFRPGRRGRFRPDEVVVRTRGRWGLVARQGRRSLPGEVRVHPRFRSRHEAELRITRARMLHAGIRATRIRGAGTEFDQLREYTVDDESRRIDWAATARAGRPIVRTHRAERNQTVVNLLDAGRVMAGRVEDVPRLEHAMDAVMTLTAVAAGIGDRCGLAVFDRALHTVVGAGSGRSQLARVTEAMFDLEPALVESDYHGAFAAALGRFRRRAMLVVHTDLVDQVVAETLLPAMPLVARHHLVVVAAVRDPDVVGWRRGPVADGDEARRRAAAASSLADRDRAAARLRAAGAMVVDAPPHEVGPRLADVYLSVKATGRL